MAPKRKYTVSGPKRASQRLKERFEGTKPVHFTSEPIEIGLSDSSTPSHHMEDQSPTEQEFSTGGTNLEESVPETEVPNVGVSEQFFSDHRFANFDSEKRYTDYYSKRAVLCERGIKLEDYTDQPYELKELIENRGWVDWVTISQRAIVPLVREFYSNAVIGEEGSNEIHTEVRKKQIVVTPELISRATALPFGNIPSATQQQLDEWKDQLSKENLVKLLSGNSQAEWEGARLSKRDLTEKGRVLHMLVCSKILPHAFVSAVNVAQAELMGKLLLDIPIDLTNHIWKIIFIAVDKPEMKSGLPFGGLITNILQNHGIRGKSGMEIVKPATRIAKTSVNRSQGQLGRKEVTGSQREQQPAEELNAEDITIQGVYDMLKEVQGKQAELQENQAEIIVELRNLKEQQEMNHQKLVELISRLHGSATQEDFGTPPEH